MKPNFAFHDSQFAFMILENVHVCILAMSVKPWSWRLIAAGAYPGSCSMKRLGVFLLPLDRMLQDVVHRRSLPCNLLGFPNNSPVPIYTPGWREVPWELSVLPKNTTPCPQPGLEPRLLTSGMSALTTRPPCLPMYPGGMDKTWTSSQRTPVKWFLIESPLHWQHNNSSVTCESCNV